MASFRENNIHMVYNYYDKKGSEVAIIILSNIWIPKGSFFMVLQPLIFITVQYNYSTITYINKDLSPNRFKLKAGAIGACFCLYY